MKYAIAAVSILTIVTLCWLAPVEAQSDFNGRGQPYPTAYPTLICYDCVPELPQPEPTAEVAEVALHNYYLPWVPYVAPDVIVGLYLPPMCDCGECDKVE